jgi:hypothetical protein
MDTAQVEKFYGSRPKAYKAVGKSRQAWEYYVFTLNGEIPEDVQFRIQVLTRGKLKANGAKGRK